MMPVALALVALVALLQQPSLPRYDLTVTLDPAARRIDVAGTVRLPPSTDVRDSVALALSERFPELQVEVIAPAASAGTPRITHIVRPYSRAGWGTVTWRIRPATPIPAGEPVVLRIRYGAAGDLSANVFSVGATSFGAGITTAWYPEVEEAEPSPTGRLRGLRGTGRVRFIMPPGVVVHSSGRPVDRLTNAFQVDRPTYFSFAAGPYTVAAGPSVASVDGRTLRTAAYFLRRRPTAREYARRSLDVLRVLEREFGPYPFDRFAIVEVPDADADRAGFAGASVDGFILSTAAFLDQPFNTAYYGHEIGHQWWGVTVRPTGARGLWMLSEGMAQYGSLRAVTALDGPESARRYRTADYPGYFDQGGGLYFRLAAAGHDAPLAGLPSDGALPRQLVDSKGFLVWDVLAQEVGRARFRAVLADVVRRYTAQRLTWDAFLDVVSQDAGRDLGWFYRQWFDAPGAPAWRVERLERGRDSVRALVVQDSPSYRVRVPARLYGARCPDSTIAAELSGRESWIALPTRCTADSVALDPEHEVVHWTPALRAAASALRPYTDAKLAADDGRDDAGRLARDALDHVAADDTTGVATRLRLLLAQLAADAGRYDEARREIAAALASGPRPPLLPLVYLQQAQLARAHGDTATLRAAVAAAIRADRAVGDRTGAAALARALLP